MHKVGKSCVGGVTVRCIQKNSLNEKNEYEAFAKFICRQSADQKLVNLFIIFI